tara:strand:+ start:193 stop:582 length:390 start_codon:yes stop_codon:yes gene_type:complete
MTVTEKLNKLLPYLQEIKFSQNMILVGGLFYPKWIVKESSSKDIQHHKTGPNEDGKVLYHFFGEKNKINVDTLLDFLEEVINENLDRERKEDLFKKKVEELKNVFKSSTLTDLENLLITVDEEEKIEDE